MIRTTLSVWLVIIIEIPQPNYKMKNNNQSDTQLKSCLVCWCILLNGLVLIYTEIIYDNKIKVYTEWSMIWS